MNITTDIGSSVDEFAAAVRRALDDLPQGDVEELTDGLEADLVERAADAESTGAGSTDAEGGSADAVSGFGDADSYAAELRAAAGLPPRSSSTRRREPYDRVIVERVRENWAHTIRSIRMTRHGAALLDFALVLQPVWWVLRGWAVYQLIVAMFSSSSREFEILPATGLLWAILLPLLLVSVQWGRGKWMPTRWVVLAKMTVSVVAAIALLALIPIGIVTAANQASSYPAPEPQLPPGLVLDGASVGNIFAYDSDGELLEQVQLFDQNGRPLDLVGTEAPFLDRMSVYDNDGNETLVLPSDDVPGRAGWNVYPLRQTEAADGDYSSDPNGAVDSRDIDDARPPFPDAQPLAGRSEADETTEPSPSPSPSSTTPEPSATPLP